MKKTMRTGAIVLLAGAAAALNACGDDPTSDEGGGGSNPVDETGGTGGTGGKPSGDGGSPSTGGNSQGGMGGLGGFGGSEPVLTPEEELALAQAEATSRCEGLGSWSAVTWLTVDDDTYSTSSESTELVHGLPGDDTISISWGSYCALGGKGDDTITLDNGDLANTIIVGGSGSDEFRISLDANTDRNIHFVDFTPGEDKFVFDTSAYIPDSVTPIQSKVSFGAGTATDAANPWNGFTVVVVPGDPGEIWFASNNEGTQYNYRLGYIDNYTTYSSSDFSFE